MHSLICFALKEEAAPFRKIAARAAFPAQDSHQILITGMGRKNAEKSVRAWLAANTLPQYVLTCGFAGGLKSDLKLGDVIFETSTLDFPLLTRLQETEAKQIKFFCADRIATTAVEKKTVRSETGAEAVEMESAVIHAICHEHGIPCATVRVVSDTSDEDLPLDFNALIKPDKNLDFSKLALAIAKSPGKIGALMALQKKTKFAAERLAAVLEKIIR